MNVDKLKAELLELEKAMMGLRADGGWKYRVHFKATDAEVQAYASKVPHMLRMLTVRALAGQELAERWGKAAHLESVVQEILHMLNQPEATEAETKESA